MKDLESILDLVERELATVKNNGKFKSREDIDSVYKLMDIAKDIYCIWDYEESGDEGGVSLADRSYGNGRSYGGVSYASGRRGNTRRDSMGRYSRRGYSMDGGADDYIDRLRDMMETAPNEQARQSIHRMISDLESMR